MIVFRDRNRMRGPERINAHVRKVRKIGRVELFAPQNSGVDNGCAAKASFDRIEPSRDIDEQAVAARTARKFVRPGAATGPTGICWTDNDGEQIASALIPGNIARVGTLSIAPASRLVFRQGPIYGPLCYRIGHPDRD